MQSMQALKQSAEQLSWYSGVPSLGRSEGHRSLIKRVRPVTKTLRNSYRTFAAIALACSHWTGREPRLSSDAVGDEVRGLGQTSSPMDSGVHIFREYNASCCAETNLEQPGQRGNFSRLVGGSPDLQRPRSAGTPAVEQDFFDTQSAVHPGGGAMLAITRAVRCFHRQNTNFVNVNRPGQARISQLNNSANPFSTERSNDAEPDPSG